MDRGERLDNLIALLRARGSATAGELARELGVSPRTVRRDIAALRLRGMDVEGDRGRGGGVRLARFAQLPPIRLDESQAVGLWLSVQLARRAAGLPFSRDGNAGLSKVLAVLPEERRRALRRLSERIVIGGPASPSLRASVGEMSPTLLDAFERCFSQGTCLGFHYVDRRGRATQRRVEPHGIFVETPVWYVLAVDIDKELPRMFRMDRISHPRPLPRRFAPSMQVVQDVLGEVPPSWTGGE